MADVEGMSIGTLAKSTGFSVERLRMWERRYGKPQSLRRSSGHRRYPHQEIERLLLVKKALSVGYRAHEIVPKTKEQIQQALEQTNTEYAPNTYVTNLIHAAKMLDDRQFDRALQESWHEFGTLRFLTDTMLPFLQLVGKGWQEGHLCVAEEHFGSEKIGDFLTVQWRKLNELNRGRGWIATTIQGDMHRLGLLMSATIAAMNGLRVIFLGVSTPLDQIQYTVGRTDAAGVMIGVSETQDPAQTLKNCQVLRDILPSKVELVFGGKGAPLGIAKTKTFADLGAFHYWLREKGSERSEY